MVTFVRTLNANIFYFKWAHFSTIPVTWFWTEEFAYGLDLVGSIFHTIWEKEIVKDHF